MSAHRIDAIEHTVQTTYGWIAELDETLGWDHRQRSYRLLRAALHALRDALPIAEVADFGAQLPQLMRGIYYEGWRGPRAANSLKSKAALLGAVDQAFLTDPLQDSEAAMRAVLAFLETKISAGEISDVRAVLPGDVRGLWPH